MAGHSEHVTMDAPDFDGPAPSVLIVASPYYKKIGEDLVAGAREVLDAAGATHETVLVPGALEIPTAIRLAAARFEGFVALGCVIRGETTHYETVCNDSSRGLAMLGLDGICIGNGILTCETMDQAAVRAAPDGQNKGGGAAVAALHLIALARRFKTAPETPPRPGSEEDILLASARPGRLA
ncbi:MAG: 6,7-dimethyl-8-ribityllumazine synthase [Pseudomonadota bacterium]